MFAGLLVAACVDDNNPVIDTDVPAPSELKVLRSAPDVISISWNASTGTVDGYTVERKTQTSEFTLVARVAKSELQTTDVNPPAGGTLTYRVYATKGQLKSAVSESSIYFAAYPQISINSVTSSYLHLTPNYTLNADGGESCVTGVCWSLTPNPTIADNTNTWHVKLNAGAKAFASANQLKSGETVYMRAFATNSSGTSYSNEVSSILQPEPAAIQLSWTAMSDVNASLPLEVRAFETATQLNGRSFKAYYIIADMSTGNIELKTAMSSVARKPTAHGTAMSSETVYAIINGGYFGYNGSTAISYSMVIDRGQKLADNIAALTRGSFQYAVTRGVFGVTNNQAPVMKWATANFAYNIPSPNVEGESPQPALSSTFPSISENLSAYSAIGGAPILLKDGKLVFDFTTTSQGKYLTNYELLQSDIFSTTARPPRTAIGRTADNKLILFVCDGRQTHSDGATLTELAQLLKGIGCVDALNLDGGGSSAIVAAGKVLNKPSDGTERVVPSVVAFVKRK